MRASSPPPSSLWPHNNFPSMPPPPPSPPTTTLATPRHGIHGGTRASWSSRSEGSEGSGGAESGEWSSSFETPLFRLGALKRPVPHTAWPSDLSSHNPRLGEVWQRRSPDGPYASSFGHDHGHSVDQSAGFAPDSCASSVVAFTQGTQLTGGGWRSAARRGVATQPSPGPANGVIDSDAHASLPCLCGLPPGAVLDPHPPPYELLRPHTLNRPKRLRSRLLIRL
jgi:hypothetical protein